MVRRDENTSAQSTDIVIAPGSDDTCMEQALALAGRLVGLGGAARVICGADSFGVAFRDLSSDKLAEPLRSSSVSHSVVTISQDGISVQQISA